MPDAVTIHAAKTHLSRLIARAEAGEEIVIARGKKPVVKIVPLANAKPKRVFGSMRGQFTIPPQFYEPMSEEELELWYK